LGPGGGRVSILSFMRRWLTVQPPSALLHNSYDRPSGERIDCDDVLGLSAANACTRLIAGTYASLPVMITRGGDDDIRVPARDHWAYRLLHDSPNGEQTAYEFFELGGASLELKGNMLALKDRTGERVTSLLPMAWDETQVRRKADGALEYEWRGEKYGSDDVLHVRGFGGDALGGLSTIAVASSTFGMAKATNRAAASMFRNGIRSQVVLGAERDLSPELMEDARRLVDERYAGSMNSGRPLILNAGWKATPLSINPEDAQLLESRAFNVEEVCRFFGVPPVLVGHTDKQSSWGTGIEQIVLGFLKFTMRPRLKRMEQALEKQLLTAADRAAGVRIEFNVEGLLRASSKERADFYKAALGDTQSPGWMIRNEVRRKENLPPIPGWDEPIQLFQQGQQRPAAAND
jgi:HK97 family phage portal protein